MGWKQPDNSLAAAHALDDYFNRRGVRVQVVRAGGLYHAGILLRCGVVVEAFAEGPGVVAAIERARLFWEALEAGRSRPDLFDS